MGGRIADRQDHLFAGHAALDATVADGVLHGARIGGDACLWIVGNQDLVEVLAHGLLVLAVLVREGERVAVAEKGHRIVGDALDLHRRPER
ncbi:MAG: hypothetical protein ACHQ4J_05790 [Candidatus Binatia bacterium]